MTLLATIGLLTYVFYLLFLVYAAASPKWSKLPIWPKILLLPAGVIFYVIDVVFNFTFGSILFLQLPYINGHWYQTLSMRMAYNKTQTGWRSKIASFVCSNLLDPFAQGHC